MKKYLLFVGALLLTAVSFAQSSKQVRWTFTTHKVADKTYELKFKADINAPYHLYAIEAGAEGPISTSFDFTKNPLVSFDGTVAENGKLISKFEKVWNGKVNYFKGTVEFVQVVKVKTSAKTNVSGTITFMVCSDEHCLAPSEVNFSLAIGE